MYSCDNKYFVSTNWLEQRFSDSNVRIIDASWYLPNVDRLGLKEFESKHIPGASFFDLDNFSDANSDLPHMALNEKDFSNKFKLGRSFLMVSVATDICITISEGTPSKDKK